jgi:hypothetical protein
MMVVIVMMMISMIMVMVAMMMIKHILQGRGEKIKLGHLISRRDP